MNGWTVLETFVDKRKKCLVMCLCGNRSVIREDHVLSGRSKYCKSCSSKNTAKEHGMPVPLYKGIGDLSGTFWSHIRRGAEKRELSFEISIEYAWSLFTGICSLSGIPIKLSPHARDGAPAWEEITASLDRIDSSVGYVKGNVQWVHKDVNYIKRDLDEAYFVELCKSIARKRA
jgi:hypothetical protein